VKNTIVQQEIGKYTKGIKTMSYILSDTVKNRDLNLAKVEVASSNLVSRSNSYPKSPDSLPGFFRLGIRGRDPADQPLPLAV
jgi:hypothetical protein